MKYEEVPPYAEFRAQLVKEYEREIEKMKQQDVDYQYNLEWLDKNEITGSGERRKESTTDSKQSDLINKQLRSKAIGESLHKYENYSRASINTPSHYSVGSGLSQGEEFKANSVGNLSEEEKEQSSNSKIPELEKSRNSRSAKSRSSSQRAASRDSKKNVVMRGLSFFGQQN